ncbi:hypothetical protein FYJ44_08320 [Desulfovibrio sp. PG-178-WT-4]|uniref:Uncharacterized protein n=1 Tax=Desulfovibrio porci TaxID=2605782 RepID=A0A6L5XLQ0_9BACT|nr:hypothetical protein [Desulfovibrio porci]MDY3810642.1 hypothetical protein [Desulfovibrio porci]MSS28045.1 hypothetical protein [Desulfovibrio porci]
MFTIAHRAFAGKKAPDAQAGAGAADFSFAGLLFVVIIRPSLLGAGGVIRRCLLLTCLSTSLLSMPVSRQRHSPWAAFRSVSAQKAPFFLPAPENLASAVATQEL